jgi:mycoredoxin
LPEKVIMYAHPACPQVLPMMSMLKQSGVDYTYININQDHEARLRVLEINQGYASVPTFVFPDGTTLTEPSAGQLRRKLETLGYRVPLRAQLTGSAINLFILVMVLWAILSMLGVL